MSTKEIGISIPFDLLETIDSRRGDVARSRYIRRLLERALEKDGSGTPPGARSPESDTPAATQEKST